LRENQLPLWNKYNGSGSPLLANFQTGAFYPLNIFYLFLPFQYAWTFQVMLEPLLASLFLYLFLKKLQIHSIASMLGGLVFAFCGFSVAWMMWNTIVHVIVWLPLILLAEEHLLRKWTKKWIGILIFAEISAIFAGHLQTLFYVLLITNTYLFCRIYQNNKMKDVRFSLRKFFTTLRPFIFVGITVGIITAVQWLPTLEYIAKTARGIDQAGWQQVGWFIPWQNLIQFIAPDFFGNPSTLNYWGVWNYAEFVGYVGISPLILSLFALFFRKDKKTLYFGSLFFLSLIFSLPTFFAKVPFLFSVPFLSTSQPTRLLMVTDFSLAILSAFGLDAFMKREKGIVYPIFFVGIILLLLWCYVLGLFPFFNVTVEEMIVARKNLFLPTLLFIGSSGLLIGGIFLRTKRLFMIILSIMLMLVAFDLLRFSTKFTPFVSPLYLYPTTKTISFLQKQQKPFRIMTTDSRMFPPNFSSIYGIESVDIYDPLYLVRYGEFVAASERGKPDINPPFGFNRIITPHNTDSMLINILNVRFILSLSDLHATQLKKVFQEGQSQIYENTNVLPRSFFVKNIFKAKDKQEAIEILFRKDFDPSVAAVVEGSHISSFSSDTIGTVDLPVYGENKVSVDTHNLRDGFLVLTDTYYPTWKAYILMKGGERREVPIIRTDYNFRGVFVPAGENTVVFYNTFMSLI
jgi:hypothetical protein